MNRIVLFLSIVSFALQLNAQNIRYKNFMPLENTFSKRLKKIEHFYNDTVPDFIQSYAYDKKGKVIQILKSDNKETNLISNIEYGDVQITKQYKSKLFKQMLTINNYGHKGGYVNFYFTGDKKEGFFIQTYHHVMGLDNPYQHKIFQTHSFGANTISGMNFEDNVNTKEYKKFIRVNYTGQYSHIEYKKSLDGKYQNPYRIDSLKWKGDTLTSIISYNMEDSIGVPFANVDFTHGKSESGDQYIKCTHQTMDGTFIYYEIFEYTKDGLLQNKYYFDDTGHQQWRYIYEEGKGNAILFAYPIPQRIFDYNEQVFTDIVPYFPVIR